jgi:hypothetical protein
MVRYRTDGACAPTLFFNWSPLVSQRRERAMSTRDKRTSSLKDRLIQDAENCVGKPNKCLLASVEMSYCERRDRQKRRPA